MSITKIDISRFIELRRSVPVLDVRSPGEFNHAHIPGAIPFPLFTDEERHIIGTTYKQVGRKEAIKKGLEPFGKNLVHMIEQAEKIIQRDQVLVHCWRGGMRSAAVAWLLDLYGYQVFLLSGGYKSYRRWALNQFHIERPVGIVGGYTGSNKTGIIHELDKAGEYVIDLEAMAEHKGSAFGNLERVPQPSQEQFENMLAIALHDFDRSGKSRIWLEHESQRIGLVNLPKTMFDWYSRQFYYFLDIPFENRLQHIIEGYGRYSKESLINAIVRIKKKLGGLESRTAVNAIIDDDINAAFTVLLHYYDKLYHKNEAKRQTERREGATIRCPDTNALNNMKKILEHANEHR